MSWLITGGCGFVGTNLADALLEQGETVAVLDNLSGRGARDNLRWLRERHGSDWPMIEADVRDADAMAAALRKLRPRFVAHLAGQVAMTTSLANPRLDFETNALGTFNLLEAIRVGSPDTALLYSSTNKVYGSLENLRYDESPTRYLLVDHPDGLDESLPLDGSSPYGCSKLCADQYCRDYHRMYGLKTVVFRHSSMYGGRQFASVDQGWIGWFCGEAIAAAAGERPIPICGNGKQVRDVLHASDLVQVYLASVAADRRHRGPNLQHRRRHGQQPFARRTAFAFGQHDRRGTVGPNEAVAGGRPKGFCRRLPPSRTRLRLASADRLSPRPCGNAGLDSGTQGPSPPSGVKRAEKARLTVRRRRAVKRVHFADNPSACRKRSW